MPLQLQRINFWQTSSLLHYSLFCFLCPWMPMSEQVHVPWRVIAAHGLPGSPGSLWLPAKPLADCCLCPGLPAASPKAQYIPGLGKCKETARNRYLRLPASGGWVRQATRKREPWVLLAGPLAAHVVTASTTRQPMQRSPAAWTHFHFKLWDSGRSPGSTHLRSLGIWPQGQTGGSSRGWWSGSC